MINTQTDLNVINIKQLESPQSKIFSFNIDVHKMLESEGIKHEIAENYLSRAERLKLFDFVTSYHDWYNNKPLLKDLEFEGINLLGLLDTHEFYSYLIPELSSFLTIKRIIEKEQPERIITSTTFSIIVKTLVTEKKTDVEIYRNVSTTQLHWDKISIKYNLGRFPISFTISWTMYVKIKNFLETILRKILGLELDLKTNRKTILLLEFNPAAYHELLSQLSKYDRNVVLLNRRRSVAWNFKSIKTLYNSKCKLVNFKKLLGDERNQISSLANHYLEKLKKLWSNEEFFTRLFSIEGHSFWPLIKDVMINTYENRIVEYVELLIISKKIFERINVSCIGSLNEIGTTEKAILDMNKNHAHSILLEHGYSNYVSESSRFAITSYPPYLRDKVALWGNVQKQYLVEHREIDPNKILITGSPRHDIFFRRQLIKKSNSRKTILITPHPIAEIFGQSDTNTHIRFENLVTNLCSIIKKMVNVKIIVKLHPSQVEHNNRIRALFRNIDPTIPVYLLNPIMDLLESSDAVVNISPRGFDPSTVILEALILNKPTMNIILDDNFYEFQYVKDRAVLSISDKDDLHSNLSNILFNDEFRTELMNNGRKHVQNYLSNCGTASAYLANLLNSY